jgi:hypothetical protein
MLYRPVPPLAGNFFANGWQPSSLQGEFCALRFSVHRQRRFRFGHRISTTNPPSISEERKIAVLAAA